MTLHVHLLAGCKPVPLAHYLKGLGVLRLVSQQVDSTARGFFKNDRFVLCTRLSRAELELFFLEQYSPTPLVAPWNGGSGFYPKDAQAGISALSGSKGIRFLPYRDAIAQARELVAGKAEAPKEEAKYELQRALRRLARPALASWLDAVVVFDEEGKPRYPALLGTGGNDGRLDFTNNFMQRLEELLDCTSENGASKPSALGLLQNALFDEVLNGMDERFAIGQFLPGGAGGANSGNGFEGSPPLNPWDFVLMLEGCVVLRASALKKLSAAGTVQAGAPFALRSSATGYGSSADSDESARGEQWMPLWKEPATFAEVQQLFGEGRAQTTRRSRAAERPLDFARSVARLGVSRGIDAFQRFGFIERNGQANLAVPLGRWKVSPRANQDLVDNVADYVDSLRHAARNERAPRSFARAARTCEAALLNACQAEHSSLRWRQVLTALGRAERALLRSSRFAAESNLRPIPSLTPAWLTAVGGPGYVGGDDQAGREWRIAVAIASLHKLQTRPVEKFGRRALYLDHTQPLRVYALPLDPGRKNTRFLTGESGLRFEPHVVFRGTDLIADLGATLERHALDGESHREQTLGLHTRDELALSRSDIGHFVRGGVRDETILDLVWPLMALDWEEEMRNLVARARAARDSETDTVREDSTVLPTARIASEGDDDEDSDGSDHGKQPPLHALPSDLGAYALYRSAVRLAPPSDPNEPYAKLDVSILRCLAAGQAKRASEIAQRRLKHVGYRCHGAPPTPGPTECRRLLASLMLPVRRADLELLARHAGKPLPARGGATYSSTVESFDLTPSAFPQT